ncbi:MAG TPA: GntR family transcriptional regulator [Calditrichaeota bacterium]|nr:GntR family transcriptional regulator [Calditrichota bacterium]
MTIDQLNPTPLYKQIVDDISQKILDGILKPGDNVGSHQELANKYNVSLITIKRALTELKSRGLLYSRVGKGTYVSAQRSDVNFSQNKIIGLVLKNLNNPFFSKILESIDKKASESNINLLLSSTADNIAQEDKMIEHFLDLGVSGIIVASTSHLYHPSAAIKRMHTNNFPYVVISYLQDKEYNHIGSDHEKGGYLATEHLVKLGYKKIAYLCSELGNILGNLRLKGYQRALEDYGIGFDENLIYRLSRQGEWSYLDYGYELGQSMVASSNLPEAVFAYNDLIAIGFEKAVMKAGLQVPDDIAIVGFDNIKRGTVAAVPITTISQPTDEIGKRAVEFIIAKIQDLPVINRIILEPALVIRDSCGARKHVKKQTVQ